MAATEKRIHSWSVYGASRLGEREIWQLPRGPQSGAPAEDVAEAHRTRLHYAIVHVVAQKGYTATTLTDIARIAKVSRSAFYAQFADKEACFLSAYEAAHHSLLDHLRRDQRVGMDWEARLRTSVRSYLNFKRDHPELAYTLLVEIHAAGANARAKRDWGHRRFAELQRRLYLRRCEETGTKAVLPTEIFLAAVAGIEEIAADYVCSGRTHQIHAAEPAILYVLQALYAHPQQTSLTDTFRALEPRA